MEEKSNKSLSLSRLRKSFRYALRGVRELFLHTPNARIHLLATLAVIIAGVLFGVTPTQWMLLIVCIVLVLSLEAINSALEQLADRVSTDYSPLIRNAKDLAAGAVPVEVRLGRGVGRCARSRAVHGAKWSGSRPRSAAVRC